jgi:hypothetical protein
LDGIKTSGDLKMYYLAHKLYAAVDVEAAEGVNKEVANFCADHEGDIETFNSGEVVFYDGSAVSYDDESITVAG